MTAAPTPSIEPLGRWPSSGSLTPDQSSGAPCPRFWRRGIAPFAGIDTRAFLTRFIT